MHAVSSRNKSSELSLVISQVPYAVRMHAIKVYRSYLPHDGSNFLFDISSF